MSHGHINTSIRPSIGTIFFFFFILLVICFRIPSFVPFSWKFDELDYLTGVREILHGEPLYTTYGDLKPPMTFWLYSLACYLGGEINILYIKILGMIASVVTAIGIYCLGAGAGKRPLGIVSALLFAGFSICARGEEMLASNSEMMMNLFVVPAYVFFLAYLAKGNMLSLLSGTLLLSAGFFTNQKAGINILVFFLMILISGNANEMKGKNPRAKGIFLLVITFLAPPCIFLLYYYFIGHLADIIFWLYEIPKAYLESFSFEVRLERLLPRSKIFFEGYSSLTLPFFYGLYLLAIRGKLAQPTWLSIILYFLLSYYAVFSGGKMMERYFIQILPPFFLVCAYGIVEFYQPLKEGLGKGGRIIFIIVLFLLLSIQPGKYFIRHMKTDKPTVEEIRNNPDLQRMIRLVRLKTGGEGSLFVFPKDRYYYYFFKRRIGSRFIEIETHLWIPRIYPKETEVFRKGWSYLFEDLEERRPKIIIDISGNFGKRKNDPAHIKKMKDKLKKYIKKNYQREGKFGRDILYIREGD